MQKSLRQDQSHTVATTKALSANRFEQVLLLALATIFASAFYFYTYFFILRRMLLLPEG